MPINKHLVRFLIEQWYSLGFTWLEIKRITKHWDIETRNEFNDLITTKDRTLYNKLRLIKARKVSKVKHI